MAEEMDVNIHVVQDDKLSLISDNGLYLSRNGETGVFLNHVFGTFCQWEIGFNSVDGEVESITLMTDGKYLSRDGENHLMLTDLDKPNRYCKFKFSHDSKGAIVLQADNGLYISRDGQDNVFLNSPSNQFCRFHLVDFSKP